MHKSQLMGVVDYQMRLMDKLGPATPSSLVLTILSFDTTVNERFYGVVRVQSVPSPNLSDPGRNCTP